MGKQAKTPLSIFAKWVSVVSRYGKAQLFFLLVTYQVRPYLASVQKLIDSWYVTLSQPWRSRQREAQVIKSQGLSLMHCWIDTRYSTLEDDWGKWHRLNRKIRNQTGRMPVDRPGTYGYIWTDRRLEKETSWQISVTRSDLDSLRVNPLRNGIRNKNDC